MHWRDFSSFLAEPRKNLGKKSCSHFSHFSSNISIPQRLLSTAELYSVFQYNYIAMPTRHHLLYSAKGYIQGSVCMYPALTKLNILAKKSRPCTNCVNQKADLHFLISHSLLFCQAENHRSRLARWKSHAVSHQSGFRI